jgi:hypothetical protein
LVCKKHFATTWNCSIGSRICVKTCRNWWHYSELDAYSTWELDAFLDSGRSIYLFYASIQTFCCNLNLLVNEQVKSENLQKFLWMNLKTYRQGGSALQRYNFRLSKYSNIMFLKLVVLLFNINSSYQQLFCKDSAIATVPFLRGQWIRAVFLNM